MTALHKWAGIIFSKRHLHHPHYVYFQSSTVQANHHNFPAHFRGVVQRTWRHGSMVAFHEKKKSFGSKSGLKMLYHFNDFCCCCCFMTRLPVIIGQLLALLPRSWWNAPRYQMLASSKLILLELFASCSQTGQSSRRTQAWTPRSLLIRGTDWTRGCVRPEEGKPIAWYCPVACVFPTSVLVTRRDLRGSERKKNPHTDVVLL